MISNLICCGRKVYCAIVLDDPDDNICKKSAILKTLAFHPPQLLLPPPGAALNFCPPALGDIALIDAGIPSSVSPIHRFGEYSAALALLLFCCNLLSWPEPGRLPAWPEPGLTPSDDPGRFARALLLLVGRSPGR